MYRDVEENKIIKNKIKENIQWISELSEIEIKMGIYFFRDKVTKEIVYIGQGGATGQNLKTRITQYFSASDSGTISFKLKVKKCVGENREVKKEFYKKEHQSSWKKYMSETFEVGILYVGMLSKHEIELEEAYLIGLFGTKFNY